MPPQIKLSSKWDFYFLFLLSLFIGTVLFNTVSTKLMDDLDRSWQYTLNYASSTNINYGSDIIFTYGPLGFVSYLVEAGLAVHLKIFSWLLRIVYVVYFFLYLYEISVSITETKLKDLRLLTKFALVPFMIISLGYFDYSIIIFMCLVHSSILEIQNTRETLLSDFFGERKFVLPIFIGCTAVFLFFIKVSYFPFIITIPIVLVVAYFLRGKFKKLLVFLSTLILVFCGVYFFFNITLKDYILNSLEIIEGYKKAMQMDFYKTYYFSYLLSISLILLFTVQLYFARKLLTKNSIIPILLIFLSIYFLFAY